MSTHETAKQKLESTNAALADEAKQLGVIIVSVGPLVEIINKTIARSGFQSFRLEGMNN